MIAVSALQLASVARKALGADVIRVTENYGEVAKYVTKPGDTSN